MKILYVTSFNQELYNATGRKLIKTFFQHSIEGELFVGYEGFNLEQHNIHLCNLNQSELLKEFLEINKDIIPDYLGGEAKPCNCSKKIFAKKDSEHKKGCHFTWWNRNCSRWFRKFVCLDLALKHNPEYLVWIDSDCIFRKHISASFIDLLFDAKDYFYMRGKKRPVDETGIFGIRCNDSGRNMLQSVITKYLNKEFRSCVRWDDSYQLMKARKILNIKQIDICRKLSVSNVADHSPLRKYITHNKGTHGRILGIMK